MQTATIAYQLVRSNRRTIGITVYPDGAVRVRAPLRAAETRIRAAVLERSAWIERTRERLAAQSTLCSDRLIVLGGERRTIRLETQSRRGSSCRLDAERGELVVTLGPAAKGPTATSFAGAAESATGGLASDSRVATAVLRWLQGYAQQLIATRLTALIAADPRLYRLCGDQPTRPFRLRRMRGRWGSCSSRGALLFNTLLACLPPTCIDYVIVHELCHLQHLNHGPGFYALLTELRPDWKADRALLRHYRA